MLQRASWQAALDEVANRFTALRDRYGPAALAVFGGGVLTNEKAYLLGKCARVALGSPHVDYNSRFCMFSAAATNRAFALERGRRVHHRGRPLPRPPGG